MGVCLYVGQERFEVGSGSFLNSFFSTVGSRLEQSRWGSRFPVLQNQLFQGHLEFAHAAEALAELRSVRDQLALLSPDQLVWDIEQPEAMPPWGSRIAPSITSLANYWWTSDGRPLLDVIELALQRVIALREDLNIR